MHPNPIYRGETRDRHLDFARAEGFGMLAVSAEGAPLLGHVPFLLNADGTEAEFHLVRSNPIARALVAGPVPARLAVQGAHGYVSPDWYGIEDQVPTWNYVAVHLTGEVGLLPHAALHGMLERLSARFEAELAPKPAWTMDKMSSEALERMLRQIVPARLRIEAVDGTWKLSQNKADAVRLGAAEGMARAGLRRGADELAALMRQVPPADR